MIDLFYFLIALSFGFFMTYVFTPTPKIVYQYPTPDTIDKTTYMDTGNNCFKYKSEEVECPKDKKQIFTIPTQMAVVDSPN